MMTTIKSPITFYAGGGNIVIDQTGHTKALYSYYWTSYSRGTDGIYNNPLWNNTYLDGYSTLRTKSIYDPCPYSYRISTNGTHNQFSTTSPKWTQFSYIGGAKFTLSDNSTWLPSTGRRDASTGLFAEVGSVIGYRTATPYAVNTGYALSFYYDISVYTNTDWARSWGTVIRCIDFASLALLLLVAPAVSATSKQNSDATGLRYQWGRKDPFTFATNSGTSGAGTDPVKIYTINGTLIPQDNRGGSNTDNKGGVIIQTTPAASMMEAIKSPITFYGGNQVVIDQSGHTKELYNYYWSSYSRGTDGSTTDPSIGNNTYLDGYSTLRTKSIYDPCPYSYRTYTNGTYNQFPKTIPAWTVFSYIGGAKFTLSTNSTWLPVTGYRIWDTGLFHNAGNTIGYRNATVSAAIYSYALQFYYNNIVQLNAGWNRSTGLPIRCIDFASLALLLLVVHSHQDASATTSGVV